MINCTFLLLLLVMQLCSMQRAAIAEPVHFNKTKSVYVCITGQLSRLELGNKIKKLLKPLHKLGYNMYIGLALTIDSTHFTNINNGDKMRLILSRDQATRKLLSVPGVQEVRHFLPHHEKNIYANMWYKQRLDNDNSLSRVQNHARQYKTLQYCNQWPNFSKLTSLTIRVRDDILFERIRVPDIVERTLSSGAVVTAACDAWAGMNDKVAFLPSVVANQFFHVPYERYLTFNAKIPALNPEKYYQYVYSDTGFQLQSEPSLYVAKAVTNLIPAKPVASSGIFQHLSGSRRLFSSTRSSQSEAFLCQVSSNAHKSFSPGCEAAFGPGAGQATLSATEPNTSLSSPAFGVSYQSKCWK